LAGGGFGKLFLSSGVTTEADLRQQGLGDRACPAGGESAGQTEHNATGTSSNSVLDHPGMHAAGAHGQTETGEIFIEENFINHARRQFQSADIGGSQLHAKSSKRHIKRDTAKSVSIDLNRSLD